VQHGTFLLKVVAESASLIDSNSQCILTLRSGPEGRVSIRAK